MKEVQMTFRVKPELRDRFTEAAELDHTKASQVLRELTQGYVEQQRLCVAAVPAKDLDPAERRRRQEAFDFARASVSLEGFVLTKEAEDLTRRFINGEIELADFLSKQ